MPSKYARKTGKKKPNYQVYRHTPSNQGWKEMCSNCGQTRHYIPVSYISNNCRCGGVFQRYSVKQPWRKK